MEEDEFVVILVEPILARHRERELVGIAVEIIDHVPLDVTIDHDLGHRRRHVGAGRDGDGEARIVILVDAVPRRILSDEVHPRPTLERDEAGARRKVRCLRRLLLDGVHAGLKRLELRLQVRKLVGPGTRGASTVSATPPSRALRSHLVSVIYRFFPRISGVEIAPTPPAEHARMKVIPHASH